MTSLRFQSFRFAIVGLVSNAVLYLLYIVLTQMSLQPSTAMSLVFITGTLQTFLFNKTWTFSRKGNSAGYLARYLIAYVGAYLINLLALYWFVDRWTCPHQVVQGVAILVIGGGLFIVQRYWVFRATEAQAKSERL